MSARTLCDMCELLQKISTCRAFGSRLSRGGDLWGLLACRWGGLLLEIEIIAKGESWCMYVLPHVTYSVWSVWRNFTGSLMYRLMALKCRVTQLWHQATKPPAHSPNFYGNKVDDCGHLSPTKVPNFPNVVASSHVNGSLLQKWIY